MAFDQAKADQIVTRLAEGEPMAEICRDKEAGMPCVTTVWNWEKENPDFAESIARARLAGYDMIAVDALRIANTPLEGLIQTDKGEGKVEIRREDMLGHRRLQVDTRLKLLAKWDPKRYGDKIQQEVDATVRVVVDDPTKR